MCKQILRANTRALPRTIRVYASFTDIRFGFMKEAHKLFNIVCVPRTIILNIGWQQLSIIGRKLVFTCV